MDSTNTQLLIDAAKSIIDNAVALQKGEPTGKKGMENYSHFSASVHSFQVYTFIDPEFESFQPLKDFKQAVAKFDEHYSKLRYEINVKADQKASKPDLEALQEQFEKLKQAFNG